MTGPAPSAESVDCVACGKPTPRGEMFGLAPDLRCPACAQGLSQRVHPAYVRRASATFRAMSGSPEPRATAAILGAAIVLWVAMGFVPPLQQLLGRLLDPPSEIAVVDGVLRLVGHPRPWQFVLWAFVHGGPIHLLMNGLSLWQLGRVIEWGWGSRTFALVMIGSSSAASAAGWMWTGNPTVGLSGGIFALIGWLIVQRRTHVLAGAIVNRVFFHSVIASVVLLLVLTEIAGWPISHVAHVAGFLYGLSAGAIASSPRPALGWAILAAATLAILLTPTFVDPLYWRGTLFRHAG